MLDAARKNYYYIYNQQKKQNGKMKNYTLITLYLVRYMSIPMKMKFINVGTGGTYATYQKKKISARATN